MNEAFSTCVANLDQRVHINTAISDCQKAFQGDYVGETFSTCVQNLDQRVHINTARETCKTVLSNAKGEFRSTQTTGSGTQNPPPPQSGGDPQAIADCMQKLMYTTVTVCRFGTNPFGECLGGSRNTSREQRRTDISENAAVRACQNAR